MQRRASTLRIRTGGPHGPQPSTCLHNGLQPEACTSGATCLCSDRRTWETDNAPDWRCRLCSPCFSLDHLLAGQFDIEFSEVHTTATLSTMASVYKTLSSSNNGDKAAAGDRKVKQRVLMLAGEMLAKKNLEHTNGRYRVREERPTVIDICSRTFILSCTLSL